MTLALSLCIYDGYNIGALLLFFVSIVVFFIGSEKGMLLLEDKTLLSSFFIYGLGIFIAFYMNDGMLRDLDRPSRFILVLPVILLLLNTPGKRGWLWTGTIIGAFCAFIMACYERGVLGDMRANGGENPIMFGNMGMLLGLINFCAATYFIFTKKYFLVSISLVCALAGIGVSVLSGSRGGWIAIPLIGSFMLWQSKSLIGRKAVFSVLIFSVVLISLIIALPQTEVRKRIDAATENIIQYAQGSNKHTSVGVRFDMWKAGLIMFQESPLFGVGNSGSEAVKIKLIEKGVVPKTILKYTHAHNEYIEALSKRGIIGVMFLLLVYLVPLKLFLSKMKQYPNNWKIKSYAMAGALIPMSYMDFSLTQVMFGHNIGVMMYVFPIAFFWAATRWAEREERELGNIA